eukprot:COSAG01_NODE_12599_length_1712_cov_14.748758_1_plen_56_part_01
MKSIEASRSLGHRAGSSHEIPRAQLASLQLRLQESEEARRAHMQEVVSANLAAASE